MMGNYGLLFKECTHSKNVRGEVKSIEGKFTAFFSGRREQNSTPAVAAAAASLLVFFKKTLRLSSPCMSQVKEKTKVNIKSRLNPRRI